MYRNHSVGVVVPAYNEEGFISDVIREMPEYVDRIFAIDDCSTDNTWLEILEAANDDSETLDSKPDIANEDTITIDESELLANRATQNDVIGRVVPIQHKDNLGAGGAIKTGYLAARDAEIDVTATVDGDGQMDLDQLTQLLDPIIEDKADYSKGNRLLYREYREEMPKFRFFGNAILTFLTKIASGYWKTTDPQNGYTAVSYYALDNVGIEAMYEYYGYCNDLLVKLNAKGMRVADVAIPAIYGEEVSSISYITYIRKVSGMLFRNFLWRLKVKYLTLDFHPLALFYIFGSVQSTLGILGAGWSLYAKFVLGQPLFIRASASLLLFAVGSMFIMFAMLFDMQVNEYKEIQIHQ